MNSGDKESNKIGDDDIVPECNAEVKGLIEEIGGDPPTDEQA